MKEKTPLNPNKYALVGLGLLTPFIIINSIVANKLQPFYSLLTPFSESEGLKIFLLIISLTLILVGSMVSAVPLIRNKKIYFPNLIISILLFLIFASLTLLLGEELVRCEVLQIPNCD